MNPVSRTPAKSVIICGAGHSGSTLLGLILGSHSSCFYCGEAAKIRYLGDTRKPLRKRVCKLCGESCPLWSEFCWRPGIPLYSQIALAAGCRLVIDSTKNVAWIRERLAEIRRSKEAADPALIFLQRDGRAVINSRLRKYPERKLERLTDDWKLQIERTRKLYQTYDGTRCRLRYEDLASDPENAVRRLCRVLGLDFEPAMLDFGRHEHHPLGGNNGTQYLVARSRHQDPATAFVRLLPRNRRYYLEHGSAIELDLRWQGELDPRHLERFEQLAGDVNRDLRWEG